MKNIHLEHLICTVPRSHYSEQSIELLAESIVATGGLLRPLIVEMMEMNQQEERMYEVVDGFLPYWAAIHANHLSLDIQRVPCWVLANGSNDLQYALGQLECIASYSCLADDYSMPLRGGCS